MRIRQTVLLLLSFSILLMACPSNQGGVVCLGANNTTEFSDTLIEAAARSYIKAQRTLLAILELKDFSEKDTIARLRLELTDYTAHAPYLKENQERIYLAVSNIDSILEDLLADKSLAIQKKFDTDKNFQNIYNAFCRIISGQD